MGLMSVVEQVCVQQAPPRGLHTGLLLSRGACVCVGGSVGVPTRSN